MAEGKACKDGGDLMLDAEEFSSDNFRIYLFKGACHQVSSIPMRHLFLLNVWLEWGCNDFPRSLKVCRTRTQPFALGWCQRGTEA